MAGSVYDTQSSPYTFREEDEAARERQSRMDIATLGAISKVTGSRSGATPAAPGAEPPPSPEQMGVKPAAGNIAGTMRTAMAGLSQPAQAPEGIQDFIAFGGNPMEQALRDRAARANMEQLDNPAAAFDLGAAGAREDLDIAQRNNREQLRNEAVAAYGGNASQVDAALRDADQQAILDRRGLNRDLATGRATAAQTGLTQAIQNALGFSQLGTQERIAKEQIQAQEREGAAGRQSQERIAFAGLAQEDRALAQNALQFESELDFRKSEAAAGRDEAAIQRAWQAAQNERGIQAQERLQAADLQSRLQVAQLQIGSAERLQTLQQTHQAAQADLDRTLQREIQGKEIEARTAMERVRMDFESVMADKGFLNAKELESLKQEFAQELQRQGFTQQTALQAAEHQARALEAESMQRFEAEQADITRRFTTSERIGAETFARSAQAMEEQQQERMTRLAAALGLEGEAQRFGYQRALAQAQQAHEAAMQQTGVTAEAAQREADRVFQAAMQREGFTQQQALQAQALQHEAAQTDKQLRQTYTMFLAEQAQEDAQFAQELGLNREQLTQAGDRFAQEMEMQRDRLGIEQDQWNTLKADQAFQKELELAMLGVQMWDGEDPAGVAPFAERLARTMGTALGLDPARLEQAIKENLGASGDSVNSNTEEGRLAGIEKEKKDLISTLSASQKAPNGEYSKEVVIQPMTVGRSTIPGTTVTRYWNPDTAKYESKPNNAYSVLYR
jgi:hypothetical protein